MKCKTSRRTIATILVTLLWSIGDVALGINGGERQEVTRLAELTQWKEGTVVADIGAGDGAYLAIIDFPPSPNSPPVEGVPTNRGGHGIPEKVMVEELTSAGLHVEKVVDDWSANDYCVIFVKRSP